MEVPTASFGYVFCLMVCLVTGRPQYNYQPASSSQNLALSLGGGSSFNQGLVQTSSRGVTNSVGPLQIVHSRPISQSYLPPLSASQQAFPDISQLSLQTQSAASLLPATPTFAGQQQHVISRPSSLNQQFIRPQQRTVITKDIFIHTAPPDADEDIPLTSQLESIPIRKNYRIIFIKAPTQNVRVAAEALRQAQAVNEERTIIYVLSKKADVGEIQKQLNVVQQSHTVNSKPEVYFIKYKTNEEAQRAQQEIQAQYDALGGSTNISDEGIAPVSSVIGALDRNLASSGSSQLGSIVAPSNQYLPPGKK